MKIDTLQSGFIRRGYLLKLITFFLSFSLLAGIFFMVITDWKVMNLKHFIFKTGFLYQKNNENKIIETSEFICSIQKKIVRLEKEKTEANEPSETKKRSITSEAYGDLGQYPKYHPGACYGSSGCIFNRGHIRFFENRRLGFENDSLKKGSYCEHVLYKNIFAHLKDNPTSGLKDNYFKLRHLMDFTFKNRPYDLKDVKKRTTLYFGDNLSGKYKIGKKGHEFLDVSTRLGFVFPSKKSSVSAATYQAMTKRGTFPENVLPKKISLFICRFSFN